MTTTIKKVIGRMIMKQYTYYILFQHMIDEVQDLILIIEIWQIKPELSPNKSHFVILLKDGSHFCTCNLLISFGIPCRHFYKVLRKSSQAKFHIKLINQRWYQDIKIQHV